MSAAEGGTVRVSLHADAAAALDPSTGPVTTGAFATPDTGALLLDGLDTGVRLAPVTAPGPLTAPGPMTASGPATGIDGATVALHAASAAQSGLSGAASPRAGARPGVVQLAIREKAALYAAYMPFLDGGGLFVPTTRSVRLGDELYLILSLMDDPNKLSVTGKVVWITPAGTPQRQQGLGVQFAKDDTGARARSRIEDLLGGTLKANRPTHTI
jgi:type IV pilus assembly protein PilZ